MQFDFIHVNLCFNQGIADDLTYRLSLLAQTEKNKGIHVGLRVENSSFLGIHIEEFL